MKDLFKINSKDQKEENKGKRKIDRNSGELVEESQWNERKESMLGVLNHVIKKEAENEKMYMVVEDKELKDMKKIIF